MFYPILKFYGWILFNLLLLICNMYLIEFYDSIFKHENKMFFFLRLSTPLMLIEKFIKHVLWKCQRFVTLVSHIFKPFGFGFILTVCVIHAINTNNSFSMFYTVFSTMDQLHWSVAPIRHLPMFLSHSCHFNIYDFENRFVYISSIKELLEVNCFSAKTKLSLSDKSFLMRKLLFKPI